ncbi:MAG: hypothetical protein NVSMB18_24350 [Acetobacteraceae bacterium]
MTWHCGTTDGIDRRGVGRVIVYALVLAGTAPCRGQVAATEVAQGRPAVRLSATEAIELATSIAATRFGDRGIAKTSLRHDRATAQFEPGQAGTDHPRDVWRVIIPERKTDIEPSGLQIVIDAETGAWRLPLRE